MSMNLGPADGGEETLNSTINTTPLVDVMLVLLIIFLITVPAILKTLPVQLPKQTNVPTQTKPDNVVLSINQKGDVFWSGCSNCTDGLNKSGLIDYTQLLNRISRVARMTPQPEVHIRGDRQSNYELVGRVLVICQRGGIAKIGFITEPPMRAM